MQIEGLSITWLNFSALLVYPFLVSEIILTILCARCSTQLEGECLLYESCRPSLNGKTKCKEDGSEISVVPVVHSDLNPVDVLLKLFQFLFFFLCV